MRDRTALRQISTTIFEPRERGIVRQFEIVKIVPLAQGAHARKRVTIAAPVSMPDGRTVPKILEIALEQDASGRWLVTAVADSGSRP